MDASSSLTNASLPKLDASEKRTAEPSRAGAQLRDSGRRQDRSLERVSKVGQSTGQSWMTPAGFAPLDSTMGMALAAGVSSSSSRPSAAPPSAAPTGMAANGGRPDVPEEPSRQSSSSLRDQAGNLGGLLNGSEAHGIRGAAEGASQGSGTPAMPFHLPVLDAGPEEAQAALKSDPASASAPGLPATQVGLHEASMHRSALSEFEASPAPIEPRNEGAGLTSVGAESSVEPQDGMQSSTRLMPGGSANGRVTGMKTSELSHSGKSSTMGGGETSSSKHLSTLGQLRPGLAAPSTAELAVPPPVSSETGAGAKSLVSREDSVQQRQPALNPFQVMDASGTADSLAAPVRTATVGRSTLAAGYQDAALGYVELKASLDASGIHASLAAATPEAGLVLQGHLHALSDWLGEHHTPVESLSVLGSAIERSDREGSTNGSSTAGADARSGGFPGGGYAGGGTGGGTDSGTAGGGTERGSGVVSKLESYVSLETYGPKIADASPRAGGPEAGTPAGAQEVVSFLAGPDSTWNASVEDRRISVMA